MLATESTTPSEQPQAAKPLLETWSENERMRHIPSIEWLIEKLDVDIRRRIGKLLTPFTALAGDDPRRAPIESALRTLCRALDRVADVARPSRNAYVPADVLGRVNWSLDHAITSLRSVDPNLFGRRYPFQTFERSKAEPLYGAFLTVLAATERLVPHVRAIDPSIDEHLYEHLVRLQEPLREQPMA
ncbi:MAG TPA: hypothetical protein VNL91_07395 [Thermoanaerobaculia bacterium]|nr:hypothetical protein [Thermoanaerobaculia bacterium]